ncbi:toxin-antitoxin system YwqK family antitoxin [Gammaproteobacteria bacterium]|nr:toxin-antitoxin system YwqK family antitoxin [Gammaproteobacteria bacterium]
MSIKNERTYHEDGKLMRITNLKDGIKVGLEDYYENGQLSEKTTFKNNEWFGLRETYYKNGQLKFKGNYKDGKPDGPLENYSENGQLYSIGTYKDGELEGPLENYDENGQLKSRPTYKDGKLDGLCEWYDENGQLYSIGIYKDGELEGPPWNYYENGQLLSQQSSKQIEDLILEKSRLILEDLLLKRRRLIINLDPTQVFNKPLGKYGYGGAAYFDNRAEEFFSDSIEFKRLDKAFQAIISRQAIVRRLKIHDDHGLLDELMMWEMEYVFDFVELFLSLPAEFICKNFRIREKHDFNLFLEILTGYDQAPLNHCSRDPRILKWESWFKVNIQESK